MADYSGYDKQTLLHLVAEMERELKTRKYGLVWDSEREPEQVVMDCVANLPVLRRVKGKAIRTDSGADNILIEGDNYHALTVLNYTHKGKVDVIYIDPPYNTGRTDWKYNNNYVKKEDGYRHSKWLNMMEKRLKLAGELLKKDGVLICAIDENEFANLYLLMYRLFCGHSRHMSDRIIDIVAVVHNPQGIQGDNFSYTHEYLLFVVPKIKNRISKVNVEPWEHSLRDDTGNSYLRTNARNCFYPIMVKDGEIIGFGEVPKDNFHPKSRVVMRKTHAEIWPIRDGVERKWRYARQSVCAIQDELVVKNTKRGNDIFQVKSTGAPKTFWRDPKYHAGGKYGTKLLNEILGGVKFNHPKSLCSVLDALKICTSQNSVVLDFFAGSGTTGHAVAALNREDGGNRRYILCTNNENDICTEVTYPRMEKAINGYEFQGEEKTELYSKKITARDFRRNADEINGEIDAAISAAAGNYDKTETKFDGQTIRVFGVTRISDRRAGLGGNLQYFRTDFVKVSSNRDQLKQRLTKNCTEMLCVREGIYNPEKEGEDYKIFSDHARKRFLCVYYNMTEETFADFKRTVKSLDGARVIYMFSHESTADGALFAGVKNARVEAIPLPILDIYMQLVKMNVSVKPADILSDYKKAEKKIMRDKDKDEGARLLRIVLEKLLRSICQRNGVAVLDGGGKEKKAANLNEELRIRGVVGKTDSKKNAACLHVGNCAVHGEYGEYDIKDVRDFYAHVGSLIQKYGVDK